MLQVIVNLWSAHMDADDWHQPHLFRPERFLDQSGNVINRNRIVAFSLGTTTYCLLALVYSLLGFKRDK